MRKTLSPADRCAACFVALLCLLMCAGVRYVFHLPTHAGFSVVSSERPYMP